MVESFAQALERIKDNIVSLRSLDESSIKQGVVLNLLDLTGWNPFDVTEVVPEYTVGNRRVDFALNPNTPNAVFIEVKRPGENLANHNKQLLEYCFQEGVKLGALTDGLTWWLYLPLQGGSWEHRRFLIISLETDDAESVAEYFMRFLAKENVRNGQSVRDAEDFANVQRRAEIAREAVSRAWSEIVEKPDEILVDLISETAERFCGFKPDSESIERFVSRLAKSPDNDIDEKPLPVLVRESLAQSTRLTGSDRLPIKLVPENSKEFKNALLQTKKAWIEVTYNDGHKEVKDWDASRMTSSSNVMGNLRSRPDFRAGAWQSKGIVSVRVSIERPKHADI